LCVANGNHTAFWFASSVGILSASSSEPIGGVHPVRRGAFRPR
jgi:hypothetical protein